MSYRDLLSFEQVAKIHSKITQPAWIALKQKEGHQFKWKMCNNKSNKDKWNYRLERALFRAVEEFSEILNSEHAILEDLINEIEVQGLNVSLPNIILHLKQGFKNITNLNKKQRVLLQQYATNQQLFKALGEEFQLWQDFINYSLSFSKEKPVSLKEKIDENSPLYGEDVLIAFTNYRDTPGTLKDYQQIINKGATSIALIACKCIYSYENVLRSYCDDVDPDKTWPIIQENIEDMIIIAAKKKDFTAVEYMVQYSLQVDAEGTKYELKKFNKKHPEIALYPLAPITAGLAEVTKDPQKKSKLYDQALDQYKKDKKSVPVQTLLFNINTKMKLYKNNDNQQNHLEHAFIQKLPEQINDCLAQIIKILKENKINPEISIDKNEQLSALHWIEALQVKMDLLDPIFTKVKSLPNSKFVQYLQEAHFIDEKDKELASNCIQLVNIKLDLLLDEIVNLHASTFVQYLKKVEVIDKKEKGLKSIQLDLSNPENCIVVENSNLNETIDFPNLKILPRFDFVRLRHVDLNEWIN